MMVCLVITEMAEFNTDLTLSPLSNTVEEQIDEYLEKDDLERAMVAVKLPTLRGPFVAHKESHASLAIGEDSSGVLKEPFTNCQSGPKMGH